jgi:hypothetical protein
MSDLAMEYRKTMQADRAAQADRDGFSYQNRLLAWIVGLSCLPALAIVLAVLLTVG